MLLGYRDRSEKELTEKLLKKGFPENIVQITVSALKESGFIDDLALAENLIRQAFQGRLLGIRGARAFMLKRGISPDIIGAVLDYNEDMELEKARKLLDKKMKSMGNCITLSEKKRLWNLFVRKGYTLDTVGRLFRNLNISKEDQE